MVDGGNEVEYARFDEAGWVCPGGVRAMEDRIARKGQIVGNQTEKNLRDPHISQRLRIRGEECCHWGFEGRGIGAAGLKCWRVEIEGEDDES
jgi:hypothetical protein